MSTGSSNSSSRAWRLLLFSFSGRDVREKGDVRPHALSQRQLIPRLSKLLEKMYTWRRVPKVKRVDVVVSTRYSLYKRLASILSERTERYS